MDYGYVFLSDEELAKEANTSVQTIKKYHRKLKEIGCLDIIEIDGKPVKRFNLSKLKENAAT